MNLQQLADTLYTSMKSGTSLQGSKDILESYDGTDWIDFVEFRDDTYNKKKVLSNNLFEIIIISWKHAQASPIHDHSKGCLLKVLDGHIVEKIYLNIGNQPEYTTTNFFTTNDICFKNGNKVLHSISSPISNSVSLHIYTPPGYVPNFY